MPENNAPLVITRIDERDAGHVADWETMTIKDAVQAGIRAVVEARKTDEPKRLMQAFVECMK